MAAYAAAAAAGQVPWEEWVLRVAARTEPAFGRHHDLLRRRELEVRLSLALPPFCLSICMSCLSVFVSVSGWLAGWLVF
jgi:hypothetical protein